MIVLGFDTATRATAVGLRDERRGIELEARDDPPPGARPGHATRLMALIVELLERTGTGWGQLDRIAVGLGPGTFTGLRIGIATARALARARGTQLVGVSTLHALAVGAGDAAAAAESDAVLAVLDARRGEVFAAGWRPGSLRRADPEPEPDLLGKRAVAPEALAAAIPQLGRRPLAVGDGAVAFRAVLERSGASIPDGDSKLHSVTAITHCRLAGSLPPSLPDEIRPEYLRLPDAEIARRAASER